MAMYLSCRCTFYVHLSYTPMILMQTLLSVSLHLEVASQHHLFMIGRGGSNIQQIMAKTGATICFPDVASMMTPGKGTIYVSGTIDSVLAARESIIVSS